MSNLPLNKDIPSSERTPLVEWLLNIIAEQQQIIDKLSSKVCQLELHLENLDEQLLVAKKLKGKPKIRASTLNQTEERTLGESKRAGSAKRSKKTSFVADEERVIEPMELPESAKFNGYREYDVQDLVLKRHNIRFLLAEYVTTDGKTIVGKLPEEYQGHYGVTLRGFVLYQHHQCRVPQPIIVEQLRELGIDISSGQVNRILICDKESFHAEQKEVLSAGLETAEHVHTDDTGARHQGKNGYCTVIGNDLFTYFSSSQSKSRDNYLRILRAGHQDFVLNEYSRSYLITQQLSLSTMVKLQFDNISICQTDEEWQAYLKQLGITSQSGVKLVTEFHSNAAEADIREYVTRRKISGGTRHDDGRRARDTFTGLKKTCRKLAYSFWQYLISRLKGDKSIPYLPDAIRAKTASKNEAFSIPIEATILT